VEKLRVQLARGVSLFLSFFSLVLVFFFFFFVWTNCAWSRSVSLSFFFFFSPFLLFLSIFFISFFFVCGSYAGTSFVALCLF